MNKTMTISENGKKGGRNDDKKYQIIIYGLVVHFLLLFAVFDIYFASPLDRGMKLIKSTNNPPAKRLVFFLADGLRAEAVYGKNAKRIPFLTNVLKQKGSWATVHTRVPTESRPGHVALLAGIYEDPSAIFKSWKTYPANFDSVLNESTNSWCWGSPSILKIFNKYQDIPHIRIGTFPANREDFGNNNTHLLDQWVFNETEAFLNNVTKCVKDCDKYHTNGNFFFLHLNGIDTAGQGFKPTSKEYIFNIEYVDENVKRIYHLFEAVFKDSKTAYVFASDHGMTDWGSHGEGSKHETEVPFITWGSGIRKDPERYDVEQIDIAPLLASVIGLNIPSNSLGRVPLQFLDVSKETLANIQLSNTLQLLETFNIKRKRTEENTVLFIPYGGLTTAVIDQKILELKYMQKNKQFYFLIRNCSQLMETLIKGLDYYHNYYQYPLLLSISLGLVGWMLFLLISSGVMSLKESVKSQRVMVPWVIILLPLTFCFVQKLPISYYFHFTFPFVMFCMLFPYFKELIERFRELKEEIRRDYCLNLLFYILGIELVVCGFFKRIFVSITCLLIGVWVFFSNSLKKSTAKGDKLVWFTLCVLLSIFPLFPVMSTTFSVRLYLLGFLVWIFLFSFMLGRLQKHHGIIEITSSYRIFYAQFSASTIAVLYNLFIEFGYVPNDSNLKCIAWFIFLIPIALIPCSSRTIATRLLAIFLGFAPFYLLVSSNYETIFSAVYVISIYNWLFIESKTFQSELSIYRANFDSYETKEKVDSEMFRRAFLFVVYIFIGFFGTGNIASINSFDPMWVRAFLTVFSPFKMTGLILIKIMVPCIFTSCVFRAINSIGKENILQMFSIILFFSDVTVLQFLFLITNKGSWLVIGSSLSHFVIVDAFSAIFLILYGVADMLTTYAFFKSSYSLVNYIQV